MSVVGIGLDLVDLKRFEALYGARDPDVLARCFTDREVADAGDGVDLLERLAGRFAAKEAVLKVIGGLTDGVSLTDIEIGRGAEGQPVAILHGLAQTRALQLGVRRLVLSLTHSNASAAAVAVGLSDETPR